MGPHTPGISVREVEMEGEGGIGGWGNGYGRAEIVWQQFCFVKLKMGSTSEIIPFLGSI